MTTNNTTTRTIRNIVLLDEDSKLPVADSIVHNFGDIVTEDCDQATLMQLMVDHDIKGIIDKHNSVRADRANQTVLERTGKKVMLQPITIKDLSWKIK